MKRYLSIAAILIMLAGAAIILTERKSQTKLENSFFENRGYESRQVILGGEIFEAHLADKDELRTKGLSVFDALGAREAMLFVFDMEGEYGFWMKDMKFSIDIVWIDKDLKIVTIERGVSPDTYPKTFFPASPALYVIELPAGTADLLGIEKGDRVNVGPFRK